MIWTGRRRPLPFRDSTQVKAGEAGAFLVGAGPEPPPAMKDGRSNPRSSADRKAEMDGLGYKVIRIGSSKTDGVTEILDLVDMTNCHEEKKTRYGYTYEYDTFTMMQSQRPFGFVTVLDVRSLQ
jgi:hypothetical protein